MKAEPHEELDFESLPPALQRKVCEEKIIIYITGLRDYCGCPDFHPTPSVPNYQYFSYLPYPFVSSPFPHPLRFQMAKSAGPSSHHSSVTLGAMVWPMFGS